MNNSGNLRFPASSADRWLTCLASVREEMKRPRETSEYADDGLIAHALADLCLTLQCPANDFVAGELIDVDGKNRAIDEDHIAYVQEYIDYVHMVMASCEDPQLFVEVQLDLSPWTIQGQTAIGDVVIVDAAVGNLHVIDLKYGKGVEVEAYHNGQMSLYGAASIDQLEPLFGEFKDVTLHIAQPRRNHWDSWVTTRPFIMEWANGQVVRTVKRIITSDEDSLPYAPSDKACRFCRAKKDCRALADEALATVSEGFGELIQPFDPDPGYPDLSTKDVPPLTPEEIFRCLHNVDMIKIWCKAVEAQGQLLLEQGQAPKPCGFKLVEGKTNRVWLENDKIERALARAGLDVNERREPVKVISVAQAEKKLGKKHRLMGDKYVLKPKGGLTVARESDKRAAIIVDVTEGFNTNEEIIQTGEIENVDG